MVETNKKQTQRENKPKQTGRLSFFAKWQLNFRGLDGSILVDFYTIL